VVALELGLDSVGLGAGAERVVGRPAVVVVAHGELARRTWRLTLRAVTCSFCSATVGSSRNAMACPRSALALGSVGEHTHGLPALLCEVERDPGFLEHARREDEVALAVLHAVLAGLVLVLDLLVGGDLPFAQELERDVELGHALERCGSCAAAT